VGLIPLMSYMGKVLSGCVPQSVRLAWFNCLYTPLVVSIFLRIEWCAAWLTGYWVVPVLLSRWRWSIWSSSMYIICLLDRDHDGCLIIENPKLYLQCGQTDPGPTDAQHQTSAVLIILYLSCYAWFCLTYICVYHCR